MSRGGTGRGSARGVERPRDRDGAGAGVGAAPGGAFPRAGADGIVPRAATGWVGFVETFGLTAACFSGRSVPECSIPARVPPLARTCTAWAVLPKQLWTLLFSRGYNTLLTVLPLFFFFSKLAALQKCVGEGCESESLLVLGWK